MMFYAATNALVAWALQDLAADAPFVDGGQRVLFDAGAAFGGLAMDPPVVRGTARGVDVARPLHRRAFYAAV